MTWRYDIISKFSSSECSNQIMSTDIKDYGFGIRKKLDKDIRLCYFMTQ